jgi:polyhydroxyalkanoate synthesis regulator phasin
MRMCEGCVSRADVEALLQARDAQIEALQETITDLYKRIDRLEDTACQKDEQITTHQEKTAALQEDVATKDTRLEALQERVDDLEAQVSTTADELATTDEQIEALQEHVADLEHQHADTHDVATTAVAKAQTNEHDIEGLDDDHAKTRDIARSAIAKAEQLAADEDTQEDAETLPDGVDPSVSPLDFFANCRQSKIRKVFVEDSNKKNTYRTIRVAQLWDEFAHEAYGSDDIEWTRDDIEQALTAHLGEKPHRMTVSRVWDTLDELGSSTVREIAPQHSSREMKVLRMDREAAEKLQERRYVGLDLLSGTDGTAATGGVTPVVTAAGQEAL